MGVIGQNSCVYLYGDHYSDTLANCVRGITKVCLATMLDHKHGHKNIIVKNSFVHHHTCDRKKQYKYLVINEIFLKSDEPVKGLGLTV